MITRLVSITAAVLCGSTAFLLGGPAAEPAAAETLVAGFVCTEGVFNTELAAPWDVLQHTRYRDPNDFIRTILITADGEPFTSAEGLRIAADHGFEDAPDLDILVIPSSEGSMERDLQDERFLDFLRARIPRARWVMTLCDGAFPLAATGFLDGRVATTFPGDRKRFAAMFPNVEVRFDCRFVVDGRFITSVGGAPSYEPAFWLVEHLYGPEHARRTAQGLVFDWDGEKIPHEVIDRPPGGGDQ